MRRQLGAGDIAAVVHAMARARHDDRALFAALREELTAGPSTRSNSPSSTFRHLWSIGAKVPPKNLSINGGFSTAA